MKKPVRLAVLCFPFLLLFTFMYPEISFADFSDEGRSLAPDLKICLCFIFGGIFIILIRRLSGRRKPFDDKKNHKDKE